MLHLRSAEGVSCATYRTLLRDGIPEPERKAHAVLVAMGDPVYPRVAERALSHIRMPVEDGEPAHYAKAILLSECMAVTHDDLDEVIEAAAETGRDLRWADHLQVVAAPAASQHERVGRQARLASDMEVLSRILDLRGAEGERIAFAAEPLVTR